jgi:Tfp pilus assembly protein PilF
MSLKPIIKSAREALDRKDYPYTLQLCTDALAFEPENYWLLVFKAVALGAQEQNEAALLEYSKAAKAHTDNPTAFQVTRPF